MVMRRGNTSGSASAALIVWRGPHIQDGEECLDPTQIVFALLRMLDHEHQLATHNHTGGDWCIAQRSETPRHLLVVRQEPTTVIGVEQVHPLRPYGLPAVDYLLTKQFSRLDAEALASVTSR
jgi:hypothetical protein